MAIEQEKLRELNAEMAELGKRLAAASDADKSGPVADKVIEFSRNSEK